MAKAPQKTWGVPELHALARSKAQLYGIDPDLFERQIRQESNFDPRAKSSAGAMGLGQFMPATAKEMGLAGDDVWDPEKNLDAAARYMKRLLDAHNGDVNKALASYNFGIGNVNAGKPWPEETRNYVARITQKEPELKAAPSGSMLAGVLPSVGPIFDRLSDWYYSLPPMKSWVGTEPEYASGDYIPPPPSDPIYGPAIPELRASQPPDLAESIINWPLTVREKMAEWVGQPSMPAMKQWPGIPYEPLPHPTTSSLLSLAGLAAPVMGAGMPALATTAPAIWAPEGATGLAAGAGIGPSAFSATVPGLAGGLAGATVGRATGGMLGEEVGGEQGRAWGESVGNMLPMALGIGPSGPAQSDIVEKVKVPPVEDPRVYLGRASVSPESQYRGDLPQYLAHTTMNTQPIIESGMLLDPVMEKTKKIASGLGSEGKSNPGVSAMPAGFTEDPITGRRLANPGFAYSLTMANDMRRMALLARGERGIGALGEWMKNDVRRWRAHLKRMGHEPNAPSRDMAAVRKEVMREYEDYRNMGSSPQHASLFAYVRYLGRRQGLGGAPDPAFGGVSVENYSKINPADVGTFVVPASAIPEGASVKKGMDSMLMDLPTGELYLREARVGSQLPLDKAYLIRPGENYPEMRTAARAKQVRSLIQSQFLKERDAALAEGIHPALLLDTKKAIPIVSVWKNLSDPAKEYLSWFKSVNPSKHEAADAAVYLGKLTKDKGRPLTAQDISDYYGYISPATLKSEADVLPDSPLKYLLQATAAAKPGSELYQAFADADPWLNMAKAGKSGVDTFGDLRQMLTPRQYTEFLRHYTATGQEKYRDQPEMVDMFKDMWKLHQENTALEEASRLKTKKEGAAFAKELEALHAENAKLKQAGAKTFKLDELLTGQEANQLWNLVDKIVKDNPHLPQAKELFDMLIRGTSQLDPVGNPIKGDVFNWIEGHLGHNTALDLLHDMGFNRISGKMQTDSLQNIFGPEEQKALGEGASMSLRDFGKIFDLEGPKGSFADAPPQKALTPLAPEQPFTPDMAKQLLYWLSMEMNDEFYPPTNMREYAKLHNLIQGAAADPNNPPRFGRVWNWMWNHIGVGKSTEALKDMGYAPGPPTGKK